MRHEAPQMHRKTEARGEFLPPVELVIDENLGNGHYRVRNWETKKTSTIMLESNDDSLQPKQIRVFRATRATQMRSPSGVVTWIRVGAFEPVYTAPLHNPEDVRNEVPVKEEVKIKTSGNAGAFDKMWGDDFPEFEDTPAESRLEGIEGRELHMPRFVTGVVSAIGEEGWDGETILQVDRDGYDREVKQYVPETLPLNANVAPDQIVVMRLEVIQGEEQWVFHKLCGTLGDSKAEVEALAYRSGTNPEFSFEADQQVLHLRERYEAEGDTAFMEREATTFTDNQGREKRGGLVLEKSDYRHGENRLDLRDREDIDIFTIDPESAKDFDDAISFREITKPDGTKVYEVGVHIADVAHFAKLGSALEHDARFRQFTRYLKLMTVPMLPEFLANTLCSLEPDKDRLTYSTIFTFNEDGTFAEDPWFGRAIIRSKKRFAYQGADDALHSEEDPRHTTLKTLSRFTSVLRTARGDRGAVSFEQRAEAQIEYGPDGKAIAVRPKERTETSLLIEDLMLAANEAQAAFLTDPASGESLLLLRAHTAPTLSSTIALAERILGWDPESEANAEVVEAIDAVARAESIEDVEERSAALRALEESDLIERLVNNIRNRDTAGDPRLKNFIDEQTRRLLKSAQYTTNKEEHFTLAVEPYLHATSPIRRYPDLIVQYLMDEKQRRRNKVSTVNAMSLSFLQEIAKRANVARYQSKRAEQDALEVAYLDIMEKAGKGARFSGRNAIIVGVGPRGVKVSLTLKGSYKHVIEIPWKYFSMVEKTAEGRHLYKYLYRGEEKSIDAFKHFGPSGKGYRTLALTIRSIDRKNRKVIFSIGSEKRDADIKP